MEKTKMKILHESVMKESKMEETTYATHSQFEGRFIDLVSKKDGDVWSIYGSANIGRLRDADDVISLFTDEPYTLINSSIETEEGEVEYDDEGEVEYESEPSQDDISVEFKLK